ncbi:MAG: hypothetical protein GTO45_14770 [Candidatus Aminicenantes bacterium]|nr:hypothetical protein [Candidatus Aminicenantes bacterium]NIM80017.1 hypothetical protein [Candidatus Aminicenantes bacterium]NIN19371.1 hypothetical protein [Candidatus Aminicenantes bacterium]NIN43270.1 hypothetical protein [Candidatus Aminicenantes bacterium]NIN86012.1 hypothetical protein [Candidatus Aminicenantes bacterium]
MRTQKMKRLSLSKHTIANLTNIEMRFIYTGGFKQLQGDLIEISESCDPCYSEPVMIGGCPSTTLSN